MRPYFVPLTLSLLAGPAAAAPVVGDMAITSAPGSAFRAEITLNARSPADLVNLQAGLMTHDAATGSTPTAWERQMSYRLEARPDGKHALIAESPAPFMEDRMDLTLGVESVTGSITRDYALTYRDGRWTNGDAARPLDRPTAPQSDRALGANTDLHLAPHADATIPFADGHARLGPAGRHAVNELAQRATGAELIVLRGWAGEQAGTDREQIAFNRAYTVYFNLRKLGIAEDAIRIITPADALAALDASGTTSPQVHVTMISPLVESTSRHPGKHQQ